MQFPDTPLHRLVWGLLQREATEPVKQVETSDVIYDIECYSNIFTVVIYSPRKDQYLVFEISERRNDASRLDEIVRKIKQGRRRMVGFNNMGYDYPVLHAVLNFYRTNRSATWQQLCSVAKRKTDEIIVPITSTASST